MFRAACLYRLRSCPVAKAAFELCSCVLCDGFSYSAIAFASTVHVLLRWPRSSFAHALHDSVHVLIPFSAPLTCDGIHERCSSPSTSTPSYPFQSNHHHPCIRVKAVAWGSGPELHHITIAAFHDNQKAPPNLPLAPWS